MKITGRLRYQVCDDKVCYPPETPKFAIETKVVAPGEEVTPVEPEVFKQAAKEKEQLPDKEKRSPQEQSGTAALTTQPAINGSGPPRPLPPQRGFSSAALEGSNWSFRYALGAAFIAGLLFNVMPCVLPVLPLKAAGFYEAAGHSRRRSFVLGVVFSLGLISVFAVLAMLVLVFHKVTWGALFSKGWFIWSIVVLLVAMAFGLFGAYTFRLPLGAY